VFFQFARRYVDKRDVGGGASEFELKSSRTISSYSDDTDHRDGHAGDRRSGRGRGRGTDRPMGTITAADPSAPAVAGIPPKIAMLVGAAAIMEYQKPR